MAKLTAEPGYERALAAALGEDLDAGIGGEGARRWEGSERDEGDPPLPQGSNRSATMSKRRANCGGGWRRLRSSMRTAGKY